MATKFFETIKLIITTMANAGEIEARAYVIASKSLRAHRAAVVQ